VIEASRIKTARRKQKELVKIEERSNRLLQDALEIQGEGKTIKAEEAGSIKVIIILIL